MIPNVDPRALKSMMAKIGMKSTEINAIKVIIECPDKEIIIDEPSVTKIELQGTESFQVAGRVSEQDKHFDLKITDDDIKIVMEKAGISDADAAAKALEKANGNIASAILSIKSKKEEGSSK